METITQSPAPATVNDKVKVTVGFKCAPSLKNEITVRALNSNSGNVSEFCEKAIKAYLDQTSSGENQAPGLELSNDALEMVKLKVVEALDEAESMKAFQSQPESLDTGGDLQKQIEQLETEKTDAQKAISVYEENETAKAIFAKFSGTEHTYQNANGESVTGKIEAISDIYLIAVDLFDFEETK